MKCSLSWRNVAVRDGLTWCADDRQLCVYISKNGKGNVLSGLSCFEVSTTIDKILSSSYEVRGRWNSSSLANSHLRNLTAWKDAFSFCSNSKVSLVVVSILDLKCPNTVNTQKAATHHTHIIPGLFPQHLNDCYHLCSTYIQVKVALFMCVLWKKVSICRVPPKKRKQKAFFKGVPK